MRGGTSLGRDLSGFDFRRNLFLRFPIRNLDGNRRSGRGDVGAFIERRVGVVGGGVVCRQRRSDTCVRSDGKLRSFFGGRRVVVGYGAISHYRIVCVVVLLVVFLLFWVINYFGYLRVSPDVEKMGLDLEHVEMTPQQKRLLEQGPFKFDKSSKSKSDVDVVSQPMDEKEMGVVIT